ncbi:N-acetyltransferase [Flavobacterium sp. H122]|uniref:GNAT family N-acetyltransferase n=1 Tax=Flavobacterium sp. H122 TaxID=2529860 RepID=UPI001B7D8299|nr:GNAT family N-acetyltransferase [Flavobacterium sp. H122]
MDIEIKKINSTESEIVTELFDKYRIFYKQPSDIELANIYIKERLEQNEAQIYVAFIKENLKPIGFTLLYPKFSSVSAKKNWHIGDLYVEMDQRKKGIGEKLLNTALSFAKNEGANFISLNTAIDNYSAQKLYENFGFVKQEYLPGYLYYQFNL